MCPLRVKVELTLELRTSPQLGIDAGRGERVADGPDMATVQTVAQRRATVGVTDELVGQFL